MKPTKPARFFGNDARPIGEVVMRRHPLALGMYAIVFLLGLIFTTHFGYGQHTEADLFPGVSGWAILGWKVLMLLGGGGALVCLLTPPRPSPKWPDLADLLHLEGITAIVAAFGLMTYLAAVVSIMGEDSGPSLAFFGVMVLAHFWRAAQAISDAQRLEALALLAQLSIDKEEERGDDTPSA